MAMRLKMLTVSMAVLLMATAAMAGGDYISLKQVNSPRGDMLASHDTVQYVVSVNVAGKDLADFQFDLSYDTAALQYVDGGYKLGDLIAGWPVHDDNILKDGHVRFGALNYNGAIPSGSNGELLIITFRMVGDAPINANSVKMIEMDGSIRDYRVKSDAAIIK